MIESKPIFRFHGRAVQADNSGYYFVRWDRAQDISVLASTRQQASNKAVDMLGPANDRHQHWRIIWERIDEVNEDAAGEEAREPANTESRNLQ